MKFVKKIVALIKLQCAQKANKEASVNLQNVTTGQEEYKALFKKESTQSNIRHFQEQLSAL